MMISEKGLLAAMKKAAKNGGYKMLVDETTVVFFAPKWYVRLDLESMPRKLAALLVEHTGNLPREGDCLWVTLKEDPQMLLEDTVREEIRKWGTGNALGEAAAVPLVYRGKQLFQTGKKECFAVDPVWLALLDRWRPEKDHAVVVGGDKMLFSCDDGTVILPAMRPVEGEGYDEFLRVWEALESTEWK